MDPAVELAEALRESIGRLVRATNSRADTLAQAHAATLGLLDRDGAMTIADLARSRGVKHQGQSRTVGELERRGYVSRTTSADDGRISVIAITAAGTGVILADRRSRSEWLASAIAADLSAEDLQVLARVPDLLTRIAHRVEAGPPTI